MSSIQGRVKKNAAVMRPVRRHNRFTYSTRQPGRGVWML